MSKYPWITLWELLAQVGACSTHVSCQYKMEGASLTFHVVGGTSAKSDLHVGEMKFGTQNVE